MSSFSTWKITCIGVPPVCGFPPVSISYSSTPQAYTSVRWSMVPCSICSGARYETVPSTEPVVTLVLVSTALTRPKSTTFTRPSSPIRTFSGFTSRWMSPARCAAPSAASTGSRMSSAARGCRAPRSRSTSRSVQPAMYSMARYTNVPSVPWSYTPTTFGCASRATAFASRMKRSTKPASAASPGCITFSASTRSRRVSTAR